MIQLKEDKMFSKMATVEFVEMVTFWIYILKYVTHQVRVFTEKRKTIQIEMLLKCC